MLMMKKIMKKNMPGYSPFMQPTEYAIFEAFYLPIILSSAGHYRPTVYDHVKRILSFVHPGCKFRTGKSALYAHIISIHPNGHQREGPGWFPEGEPPAFALRHCGLLNHIKILLGSLSESGP